MRERTRATGPAYRLTGGLALYGGLEPGGSGSDMIAGYQTAVMVP